MDRLALRCLPESERQPGPVRRRDGRGVALVEFAIALPFLALLTLGAVDFGRAYILHVRVKNAAREGAAFAQYHPTFGYADGITSACDNPQNIAYRAREETGNGLDTSYTVLVGVNGATPTAPTCAIYNGTPPGGGSVTVKVQRTFTPFTPLISNIVGNPTVSASVTVNVQGPG